MPAEFPFLSRKLFEDVANACGTDKASTHGYQRFYPAILSQLPREDPFTILEIGYGDGGSIPLWKKLFPNASLVCLDRDVTDEGDGYIVLKADQNDLSSIRAAIQRTKSPVRLVIDDGSHLPRHQLSSFSMIFEEALQAGGFYIVEDIETSYWLSGNLYGNELRFGLFCRWSAIEAFKLAIDYVNRAFLSPEDRNLVEYSMTIAGLLPSAAQQISSVTFGQNCVLVAKTEHGDQGFLERAYDYTAMIARD